MSQTVVLKVGMSCQGCVGAVKRVLGKMEGVESFDIDIEQQKVTVKGNVQPEAVLQTVSKTGKASSYWEAAEAPAAPESKTAETPAALETKPAEAPESKTEEAPAEPESKPTEAVAVA
ncbi:copper transport protein ATX1-like [Olea europaea var. sylvestris]|uniref:copper transport protein ATX1-like n=1 Tax=Olea europaea var. sylvestris TaxID=158386 RepID=UPI000C1D221A|nr:copper transport protein ATX1-like [Olea europaea var. sylvestris]